MANEFEREQRVFFAKNLVMLQKLENIRNQELSYLLGVTVQMISRYRSGKDFPSFEKMQLICQYFRCTMEDLLRKEFSSNGSFQSTPLERKAD